ncbi:hypothetical protein BDZ97DRAFT_1992646 [Flammula alnicola]|nr:hypothetical protein BDZ97DRAFT_1992646 [Flammula alnicola]
MNSIFTSTFFSTNSLRDPNIGQAIPLSGPASRIKQSRQQRDSRSRPQDHRDVSDSRSSEFSLQFLTISTPSYRSDYTLNAAQQHQQQARQALRDLSLNTNGSPRRRIPARPPNSESPTPVPFRKVTPAGIFHEPSLNVIQSAREGCQLEDGDRPTTSSRSHASSARRSLGQQKRRAREREMPQRDEDLARNQARRFFAQQQRRAREHEASQGDENIPPTQAVAPSNALEGLNIRSLAQQRRRARERKAQQALFSNPAPVAPPPSAETPLPPPPGLLTPPSTLSAPGEQRIQLQGPSRRSDIHRRRTRLEHERERDAARQAQHIGPSGSNARSAAQRRRRQREREVAQRHEVANADEYAPEDLNERHAAIRNPNQDGMHLFVVSLLFRY